MTLADLLHQLGDISPERIRVRPPPGTATEADLIAALDGAEKILCELIDGVLVEKVVGARESYLALYLARLIGNFLEEHDLGLLLGADGPFRILPGQVRLPDVSVVFWDKLPGKMLPDDAVLRLVPDLAIEVISKGNTKGEIARKLREYLLAGVQQVWIIHPKTQSAEVYHATGRRKRIGPTQSLSGGDLLPGFEVPMAKLFERVQKPKRKKRK
jgi:Uma2 family endonuclease